MFSSAYTTCFFSSSFCFLFLFLDQMTGLKSSIWVSQPQPVVEAPLTFLITLTFAVLTRRLLHRGGDQYTQPGPRLFVRRVLPSLRPSSCLCPIIFLCFFCLFVWIIIKCISMCTFPLFVLYLMALGLSLGIEPRSQNWKLVTVKWSEMWAISTQ